MSRKGLGIQSKGCQRRKTKGHGPEKNSSRERVSVRGRGQSCRGEVDVSLGTEISEEGSSFGGRGKGSRAQEQGREGGVKVSRKEKACGRGVEVTEERWVF